MTISSPSPPVVMTFNRAAAPLKGGHLRPPPPLNVFNTDPPSTPAATAAHPLHQQNVPATKAAQGAEAKKILNAFNARKKDLEANEPEIWKHFQDLVDRHKKGSPVIQEFKRMIGQCRGGNFNTPELSALKKRILIKEWGKTSELGSWKQVLDRHGQNVAYAALRQGTLPYVPTVCCYPGTG